MNLMGTKQIETSRLILKVPTMKEQKRLWKILRIADINRYYLDIDKKFKEKLLSWEKQEPFYESKIEHALDNDKFEWSIFLKENDECIGQINSHNSNKENYDEKNDEIMSVGWFIDPKYQGKGYATEAAKAMVSYMFNEIDISEFRTSAAICNPASWKMMEKLGFIRDESKTIFNEYTFVDELVESYLYGLTKEMYLLNSKIN